MLLAEQQLAGALRITPHGMSTSGELRTPEMTARINEAFGVQPFNLYGTTEGLWAADCEHTTGMHLFEDTTLVENVDEHGHPVPDGEQGARLLITNLTNRTQPLIRLELADAVTIDPQPCPCGRTLRRLQTIEGRTDDVLRLPGTHGTTVAVHPLQFAVVAHDHEVIEFQVLQEGSQLRILVVPRDDALALKTAFGRPSSNDSANSESPTRPSTCRRQPVLQRQPGGKLQIVVADHPPPTPIANLQ